MWSDLARLNPLKANSRVEKPVSVRAVFRSRFHQKRGECTFSAITREYYNPKIAACASVLRFHALPYFEFVSYRLEIFSLNDTAQVLYSCLLLASEFRICTFRTVRQSILDYSMFSRSFVWTRNGLLFFAWNKNWNYSVNVI